MQSGDKVIRHWSGEAIDFMRDASEFGDYYKKLAAEITPYLPAEGHICDAGCGLGYLSKQLATACKKITAIDLSKAATDFARKTHCADNLEVLCGDINECSEMFDAMVFCYFGGTNDILRIAKKLCLGNTVIIKRNSMKHRFSVHEAIRKGAVNDAAQLLNEYGVEFARKSFTFDLGQPFRTEDDAVRFFKLYNTGDNEITVDMILPRLKQISHPEYRFYLPEKRSMDIFAFQASELPKEVLLG